MKQLLQSLKNGTTEVASVPCPALQRGHLLIASARTLISAGTERMLVDFGKASLLSKVRQQPDKVRMVLEKIKTDGVMPTIESVLNRLEQPLPTGYCNVGVVRDIGEGVVGFAVGERVASNGKHAEVVNVPANLCAKVPAGISDDEAAFTVIGAIALQGIRLAQPTLGEAVAVTGLGLIGLVTVQLLRAHGCRVMGLDYDTKKLALAAQFGADVVDLSAGQDPLAAAERFSRGRGVDAVIITAATKSSEPVHQAALMCRRRGRIILVGVTGLELSRDDFYKKELTFQVSASYGPGRYDPNYEEKGHDYPVGFVRWTEQRNFEAVLDMMASGRLDVKPLISHRFRIDDADKAYAIVGRGEPSLGILLEYAGSNVELSRRTVRLSSDITPSMQPEKVESVSVGFIGAGNYANSVLIPAFKTAGARLRSVASGTGVSAVHVGRKFGFEEVTTDNDSVFADPAVTVVAIATRHDSHAMLVCRALAADKHVFVEKPLALRLEELDQIEKVYADAGGRGRLPIVMVGFNRRFAPQIQKIKALLASAQEPKAFVLTVNAGAIPSEHWTQDMAVGGGRIIGEACHFIDLLRFLAGTTIVRHGINRASTATADTATIELGFDDGSIGTIHYFSNGNKSVSKERLEVFAGGRILQLDNFRKLTGHGWPGFRRLNLWRQDKGQRACAAAFVNAVKNHAGAPVPFAELIEVSRVSIEVAQLAR